MAINRNGSDYSQFRNGGDDIQESIRRLAGISNRGKGRLKTAPTRGAIDSAASQALPSGADPSSSASGIVSPLQEQAYTGSTYYSLVSSDGLFTVEFPDQTSYIDDNGAGDTYVFEHIDPAA